MKDFQIGLKARKCVSQTGQMYLSPKYFGSASFRRIAFLIYFVLAYTEVYFIRDNGIRTSPSLSGGFENIPPAGTKEV